MSHATPQDLRAPGPNVQAPEPEGPWRRPLAAAGIGLALAAPLASFLLVFPLVENLPKWDQWSLIEVWEAHFTGQPVLPLLVKPYNGHLNVVPRFVFYVMGLATHWDVRYEVLASYAAACLTLGLMIAWLPRELRRPLAAPLAVQVFSFVQWENFVSGYPFGQMLSQALLVATLGFLRHGALPPRRFAAAALAATAATFSWGAGLAAWLAGFPILLISRARRGFVVLWGFLAILSILIVRYGSHGAFPLAIGKAPAFFLAVLGRPWMPDYRLSLPPTIALGGFACALFGALAVAAWRNLGVAARPWLWLGGTTLMSAALIALGRAGSGLGQSRFPHYATATYPLVIACCALAVLLAIKPGGWRTDRRRSSAGALAGALCLFAIAQPIYVSAQLLPHLRARAEFDRRHSDRIVLGIATDAEIRASHHPEPSLVRWGTDALRRYRLALFRDLRPSRVRGRVDRLLEAPVSGRPVRLAGGERFTADGWAVQEDGAQASGVHLWVGDRVLASTDQFSARPDVTRSLGLRPETAAGWRLEAALAGLEPGQQSLRVTATDASGLHYLLLQSELDLRPPAAADRSPRP